MGSTRPSRATTRQEVLRDFRRRQILEAAWDVFGECGYGEASVDRIAEAAGVARSTVYVYFDGKEAILEGCLAMGREELGLRIAGALEKGEGAEERVAAFLGVTMGYVGENRGFFRTVMAVFGLDAFFGTGGSAELASLREESRGVLVGILREGMERGELPAMDLDVAGDLLATLLYGALMRRSHAEAPEPEAEEGRRLARLFLRGVAGLAPAPGGAGA